MKDVSAILCADLHLREDTPACRLDDYRAAQSAKLDFIHKLRRELDVPVLCAGDVFHSWRCSVGLVTWAMTHLPHYGAPGHCQDCFYVVAGQHEIPYHKLSEIQRSPLYLLVQAGRAQRANIAKQMYGFSVLGADFGVPLPFRKGEVEETDVLLAHHMVWHGEKPYPSAPDEGNAQELLERSPFRTIVTGDNHKPFVLRHKGKLLVNCGSMMRMDVSQHDYKPCVWLWSFKTNEAEAVPLPIVEGVVDREHHVAKQERDERVQDFISKLGEVDVTLDFRENLRRRLDATPELRDQVKDIVWRALE